METWQIALIVVAVLVAVSVVWIGSRRQRTQRLTDQYGPEYERAVESSRRSARRRTRAP